MGCESRGHQKRQCSPSNSNHPTWHRTITKDNNSGVYTISWFWRLTCVTTSWILTNLPKNFTPLEVYNMPLGLTRYSTWPIYQLGSDRLGKVFEAVGICRDYWLSVNRWYIGHAVSSCILSPFTSWLYRHTFPWSTWPALQRFNQLQGDLPAATIATGSHQTAEGDDVGLNAWLYTQKRWVFAPKKTWKPETWGPWKWASYWTWRSGLHPSIVYVGVFKVFLSK